MIVSFSLSLFFPCPQENYGEQIPHTPKHPSVVEDHYWSLPFSLRKWSNVGPSPLHNQWLMAFMKDFSMRLQPYTQNLHSKHYSLVINKQVVCHIYVVNFPLQKSASNSSRIPTNLVCMNLSDINRVLNVRNVIHMDSYICFLVATLMVKDPVWVVRFCLAHKVVFWVKIFIEYVHVTMDFHQIFWRQCTQLVLSLWSFLYNFGLLVHDKILLNHFWTCWN